MHVLRSVAAFRHIPTLPTSEILSSACTNLYVHSWKISLIGGINYEGHRNGPLQSTLVCAAMGFYEITIIAMAVKKARRYHERKIWEKVCAIQQDLEHAEIRFNFEHEYLSPLQG